MEAEVKQRFKQLKINLIKQAYGKNLSETDIKLFLVLVHIPDMTVSGLLKYFRKTNQCESLKIESAIRRSLGHLQKHGFVHCDDSQRPQIWNANVAIITQTFLSYYEAQPEVSFPEGVDVEKFKQFLSFIRRLSKEEIPENSVMRRDVHYIGWTEEQIYGRMVRPAINERQHLDQENYKKIGKLIDTISLREDPMQIHRHFLHIITQLCQYLNARKTLIRARQSPDFKEINKLLKLLRTDVHEKSSDELNEQIAQFENIHLRTMGEEVRNAFTVSGEITCKLPLFLENLDIDSIDKIDALLKELEPLQKQFKDYIKEYVFVRDRVK